MPPMEHTSSGWAPISRRGARMCSRSTPSTAHVTDSVSLALAPGTNNAFGMPIPPFLPQALTATISDNEAAMFVAKYTTWAAEVYAGYEHIRYSAPSDPQTAFTDIAGNFLCLGCQAFNTRISTIRPSA